jgi:predicted nucleotidyltransferase
VKTLIKKTQKEVFELVKQYTEEIKTVLVESLRKVIFYGSYAKRDFNEESDIDILLMVSGEENLNIEVDELEEI